VETLMRHSLLKLFFLAVGLADSRSACGFLGADSSRTNVDFIDPHLNV
jgi:hypothetical protein